MSYYRDQYLKSDDWKYKRLHRLYAVKFTCELCGTKDCQLDVHHLEYKNLVDVELKHVRALCRGCHDRVHKLMVKYPKLNTLPQHTQWMTVLAHLNRNAKAYKKEIQDQIRRAISRSPRFKAQQRFWRVRNVLVAMRIVKRKRFKWTPECMTIRRLSKNPIRFLSEYIPLTGIDPRYRADRIGPHKLLTFPG